MNVQLEQLEIMGIEVEGLTTSREEFVISTSGLKEGERITVPGEDISKAIKNLYQTGLFTNIKIVEEGRQGQGILLKIKVQEQPRLEEYKIRGVKSSAREDLKKQITLIRGYADRKSTRLNSSHVSISYAVLCLQEKIDE